MYVRAGRPAFARPCVGIHKSTSLMSSSLLLQQCPACLVRLTWIVFVIGGRWPYSWCLVGCCCQDLFSTQECCVQSWTSSSIKMALISNYLKLICHLKRKKSIVSNVLKNFRTRYCQVFLIQIYHSSKSAYISAIPDTRIELTIFLYLHSFTLLMCYHHSFHRILTCFTV